MFSYINMHSTWVRKTGIFIQIIPGPSLRYIESQSLKWGPGTCMVLKQSMTDKKSSLDSRCLQVLQ